MKSGTYYGCQKKAQKRRGMNHFQYYALRDVLKVKGDRTNEFVEDFISKVEQNLTISKVEKHRFLFTSLDIFAVKMA